ncbi:MAG TPA: DUF1428 domain-containing protein, partial [Tianweitania sediminis]|nr:DUF1428 domain-containing protein [Tianweitania sediminis]
RMKGSMDDAPFDGKRMIFGGFETVVAPQQASEPAGYVDGFVLPIETGELDRFRSLVQDSAALWTELGALSMGEAVADDAPVGELTSFPRSVRLKEGETVGFAFLTYRSRAHRDEMAARMTADKRSEMMQNLPVDRKRMFFGGFRPIVQA